MLVKLQFLKTLLRALRYCSLLLLRLGGLWEHVRSMRCLKNETYHLSRQMLSKLMSTKSPQSGELEMASVKPQTKKQSEGGFSAG